MDIILDSTADHYESGQTVSGVVRMITTESWHPSDISLALVGYSKVEWAPDTVLAMLSHAPITHSPVFFGEKTCLELFHHVNDQEIKSSGDSKDIPFHFQIPTGIPSSYESDDAEVVYEIVVITKAKKDEKEHRVGRKIKILSPLPQNILLPVTSVAEKHFETLSFGSGCIVLLALLNRKGHYPGEKMVFHVDVRNNSSVDCTPRATLYMTKILLFGERHKSSQTALSEAVVGKKVDKESKGYEVLSIPLPEDASLSIKSEQIVIKYFIDVTLDIPHAFDIHVNLPIIVTTRSALNIQD